MIFELVFQSQNFIHMLMTEFGIVNSCRVVHFTNHVHVFGTNSWPFITSCQAFEITELIYDQCFR